MITLLPQSTAFPGGDDERDALAAPVGDALWMLGRQWQTGEFRAADGGSAISAEITWSSLPLIVNGVPVDRQPIEAVVEAEQTPPSDGGTKVRVATELIRRLRSNDQLTAAQVDALSDRWATTFPFRAVDQTSKIGPFTGRIFDAAALIEVVATADGLPDIDPVIATAVETEVHSWRDWASTRLGTGPARPAATWNPERLEYAFGGELAAADGARITLVADGYYGNGVDWHSFDVSSAPATLKLPKPKTTKPTPMRVSYPGMPRPRFWEFEDGHVNLDRLRLDPDPGRMLLATFAHEYSNDWFIAPLELEPGGHIVTSIRVRDTFGTTTTIRPGITHEQGPWRIYDVTASHLDGNRSGSDSLAGLRILPPPAAPPHNGPTIEEALITRDELANLAWLIELHTRDADGNAIDRHQRWMALAPSIEVPSAATSSSAGRYVLGTVVPDHWYPLTAAGSSPMPMLEFRALPAVARPVTDDGVQGTLLPKTHAIVDEEAPREGSSLFLQDRLVTGPSGLVVWRARSKKPGTASASSGLRFDIMI